MIRKPPRRLLAPGLVPPEWRWAWRGLVAAFPFWEGGGERTVDVSAQHYVASGTGQTWTRTREGLGVQWSSSAGWTVPTPRRWPTGASPFTVFISGQFYTQNPQSPICVVWGTNSTRRMVGVSAASDGTTHLNFFNWSDDQATSHSFTLGDQFTFAGTYDGGTAKKLYVDGVLDTTATLGGALNVASSSIKIGYDNTAGSWVGWQQPISAVYVWDRELTASEIAQLHHDPYGFLRLPEEPRVVYDLAAPQAALSGTSALTFTVSAPNFLTNAALSGTSALTFATTGTLTVGSAALSGTSHLQFGLTGTLYLPVVDLTGTTALRFGVNGAPGVSVPIVTGPTGVSIIVRRPVLTVKIDGVEQTNIASASCHFGFDARFATAEIQYKSVSGVTPTYWAPVEITMGAGSHNVPRFYGYILPIDNTSFPKTGILRCRGPLGIAANLPNAANEWNPFSGVYGTDFNSVGLTGTFSKTEGSPDIVGTGTAFTTELAVGMPMTFPGPEMHNFDIGNVLSITDDTHLTIDTPVAAGHTASGFSLFRGRMDQEIADFILSYYGLSSRYQFTPPAGGGFGDTVGGTGTFLGVLPNVPTWIWPMGTPGLDYLDQLDQACAAQDANGNWGVYKTFETVGGEADKTVFRTLITANPQASADDADFRLAEGVDLLKDMQVSHDPSQVVNGIRVVGGNPFQDEVAQARYPFFMTGSPTVPWIPSIPDTPPPYLTAGSFYLPSFLPNLPATGYPVVLRDFSFPMIERSIDDAAYGTAWNLWNGLTAEAKARQLLQELNTEVVTLRVSTYRDDVFGPGQTLYIYAPNRAGIFQTLWLNALDITMSDKRVFRQHLTLTTKN